MDYTIFPKASDVILALQQLIAKHGDLHICADDPDTDMRLPIGIVYKEERIIEEYPERFEIKTTYSDDEPKGFIKRGY